MTAKRLRRAALTAIFPAALMLNMSGASATTVSPLSVASGASPFSACQALNAFSVLGSNAPFSSMLSFACSRRAGSPDSWGGLRPGCSVTGLIALLR